MIKSIIDSDYNSADAVVFGVPYESTASFGGGTHLGPKAVFEVLDSQIELFDRYSKTEPAYEYRFSSKMLDDVKDKSPEAMVTYVAKQMSTEHRFILLIGGEHSVTIPALQDLRTKYPNEEITVVQIDAHFDLREDDSEYNDKNPNIYAHSTVMRHAYSLGFQLLPIGVRTMYKGEFDFVNDKHIKYFEWGRYDIPVPSIQEVIDSITTDRVYLTVDVDGFDPSVMPATGTPVPGGLSWQYGEGLIIELMKQKKVLGADIVEVATVEHSGQTEYGAGQLAYHILSGAMCVDNV